MADGEQKVVGYGASGTVATSDATETTLCSYRPPSNCSALLVGTYIAQDLDTQEKIAGGIVIALVNVVSSVATVSGNTSCAEADPSSAIGLVDFDASGQDARLRVVGTAARNIRWFGTIQPHQVEATIT